MRSAFVLLLSLFMYEAIAQSNGELKRIKSPKPVICYASSHIEHTSLPPPQQYLDQVKAGSRTMAANIVVTYSGFTPEARAAFQQAVDIWASLLETSQTIRIHAQWQNLGNDGTLGQAGPGDYFANFEGAPKRDVFYPVALAEKLSGQNLNGTDPDIVASFNSVYSNWHYGLLGNGPKGNNFDLVSIVMHEIGHGLGISRLYTVDDNNNFGYLQSEVPVVYEASVVTKEDKMLIGGYTSPSTALRDMLTSPLKFRSSIVPGTDAKLYAPATFRKGSSIAHLDEDTYPANNENSLMTPFIGAAERMLSPGPIGMAILQEIGWTSVKIKHTPLKSTESAGGPYQVIAQVTADGTFDANSLKVNYKTTGATFTELNMTPTANPNEFAADLPAGGSTYNYYISVKKDDGRTITNPGISYKVGQQAAQTVYSFDVGPDTKAPFISHNAVDFITTIGKLNIQAIVSDNLGVKEVFMELKKNGVSLTEQKMNLVPGTDSTYAVSLQFNDLVDGDKIEYRVRAKDISVAGNTSFKPKGGAFYNVSVFGLTAAQDSYRNSFDDLSASEFFGNGFTVSKPTGFNSGAIHSDHPYGSPNENGEHFDFIYNLKVPVRIADTKNATFQFDEIVLVEPGETGVAWPQADFYDYVVVEGSKDKGKTWTALGDGYDSRTVPAWLSKWSSATTSGNSSAAGDPTLYRTRTYDLLSKFSVGDEVAFRFRLYSDAFTYGWGWSIDNLKIRIDDQAPEIAHDHHNFILSVTTPLVITSKITDVNGLGEVTIEYNFNGGTLQSASLPINATGDYIANADFSTTGIKVGDEFQYRIRAKDTNGNTSVFPATGFIKVPYISFANPVDGLTTDFVNGTENFTGNFFSVKQPDGFTSPAMTTNDSPYSVGRGLNQKSDFIWMTKKAIKVSATNPRLYYEDVVLVEYSPNNSKDYVVIEGSKDGITWEAITPKSTASTVASWKSAYDANTAPTNTLLQKHTIDLTISGKFKAGDVILIRFRLHSDNAVTGWGWLIDNLYIQGEITGLEEELNSTVTVWPNPVLDESVRLSLQLPGPSEVDVQWMSLQGQVLSRERVFAQAGKFERDYAVEKWSGGIYIVRISTAYGNVTRKIVKK